MAEFRGIIHSEDITGLDLTGRPAELEFGSFAGQPVSELRPESLPRSALADIERALVDLGWRAGVRECKVTVELVVNKEKRRTETHLKARLTYAA